MPDPANHYHHALKFLLVLAVALNVGCGDTKKQELSTEDTFPAKEGRTIPETEESITYRETKWEELIPKEDLDALLNPPDYLDNIAEGSEQDEIPTQGTGTDEAAESRYQQALKSPKIKPEFDRQQVRIPGFVVPLEFDDEQTITSFLLVPYFGACLHLPPPPPNQVIYADFPEGFQVPALFDPFYIEGELRTLPENTEQGMAAYTMKVKRVVPYEE